VPPRWPAFVDLDLASFAVARGLVLDLNQDVCAYSIVFSYRTVIST
jgi:hypothetical protein